MQYKESKNGDPVELWTAKSKVDSWNLLVAKTLELSSVRRERHQGNKTRKQSQSAIWQHGKTLKYKMLAK